MHLNNYATVPATDCFEFTLALLAPTVQYYMQTFRPKTERLAGSHFRLRYSCVRVTV